MHKIDTATAVAVMPAPAAVGNPGYFTRGNPGPGVPVAPTQCDDDFLNAVMMELVNIATAAGAVLDKTRQDQALTAIKALIQKQEGNYFVTGGGANAYTLALPVAPASYADLVGVPFRLKFHAGNTGPSTININGLGTKVIARPVASDLRAGDLPTGGIGTLVYDGTRFQVLELIALSVMGSGRLPSVIVPNTNTPTTIATANQGLYRVSFDDGSSNAYIAEVPMFQFATSLTVATVCKSGTASATFSMSGTNLQMAVTGTVGPVNVGIVQIA